MRDLACSVARLSWALPLLVAEQAGSLLAMAGGSRHVATALDAVARAAAASFRSEEEWGRLHQFGTCLQNAAMTMGPSFFSPELFDPRAWWRLGGEVAERSVETGRTAAAGHAALLGSEFAAKGEVFCLVLDVAQRLGIPPGGALDLPALLRRAYGLGSFPALWAVEGLGHEVGDRSWQGGRVPHRILSDDTTRDLPAESLLMLHAGIGLSFAQHRLSRAESAAPETLPLRVAEILKLCRENSRPGYLGAAYESLGLVTRTFHPRLVAVVDRILCASAPEVLGFFWHGVGRALFFNPINFLPGSSRLVFAAARQEAPDEDARRSAVAGAAWASVLVFQRDPRLLADLVLRSCGAELARDGAFANGVSSALIMRQDTTPGAPFLAEFLRYRPDPTDAALAALWETQVRVPGEEALQRIYPALCRANRLDEVFRHQDLSGLVARLAAEGSP